MADLCRVRTTWGGTGVVGPGVSTFYFHQASTGFLASLDVFWDSLKFLLAPGVQLQTLNSGDLIDEATGVITGAWTDGVTSNITSAGSGGYAAGVGARIVWPTGGIVGSRRVKGATFIAPLAAVNYDGDGTIGSGAMTTLSSAAAQFITNESGQFVIYSRPTPSRAGSAHDAITASVPDKVSWLRSRRT